MAMNISPHWIYSKHPSFFALQILLSIIQLVVGFYCFKHAWKERNNLETKKARYILAGLTVSSLFAFETLAFVVLTIGMLTSSTKGFISFEGTSIKSVEKVFGKNGKTIHLIPMIHIGQETFYKDVSRIEATRKTLLLLEGVTDEKKLMAEFDYSHIAKKTGLDQQSKHFAPAASKNLQKNLDYRLADVDVSEFSPGTRSFLNKTLKSISEKSLFETLFISKDDFKDAQDMVHLTVDLLDRRNAKVLKELRANENAFEVFYIPWGAMHMQELEREIIKMGYIEQYKKERDVISMAKITEKMFSEGTRKPTSLQP